MYIVGILNIPDYSFVFSKLAHVEEGSGKYFFLNFFIKNISMKLDSISKGGSFVLCFIILQVILPTSLAQPFS